MDKQAIAWLYRQLPDLISRGILSPENAQQLIAYYGPIEEKTGRKTFLMAFGIIGVLLVGLGVILILAHNWASISRFNRLMISVGLLGAAQLVSILALLYKKESQIWRESSAILHMLMLGAAIALVGQTYHLSDDTETFLLTWMILSLPLIYLMKASGISILYLIGITCWSVARPLNGINFLIWPLLAAVLPFYAQQIRRYHQANATILLSWCVNLCFYFCYAATFGRYFTKFNLILYSCLFSIHLMTGLLRLKGRSGWQAPFHIIGLAGGVGIAFALTFNDFWRHALSYSQTASTPESLFLSTMVLLALGGNLLLLKKNKAWLPFSVAPLLIGAAYLLQSADISGTSATLLLNVYIVWLSISTIGRGITLNSIGIVNSGMLLLSTLIFARFLDSNFSFVIRGLVFVLLGIGFLLSNWVMVRRQTEGRNEE